MTDNEQDIKPGEESAHLGDPADGPSAGSENGKPEPPANYDPNKSFVGSSDQKMPPTDGLESARKMIGASQIMALVSIVIGGVVLSSAALVVGIVAYRKVSRLANSHQTVEPGYLMLKRSGAIAVGMGAIALILNAVALIALYPMISEMLNTGDYSSMWGSTGSSESSSSSFWG